MRGSFLLHHTQEFDLKELFCAPRPVNIIKATANLHHFERV